MQVIYSNPDSLGWHLRCFVIKVSQKTDFNFLSSNIPPPPFFFTYFKIWKFSDSCDFLNYILRLVIEVKMVRSLNEILAQNNESIDVQVIKTCITLFIYVYTIRRLHQHAAFLKFDLAYLSDHVNSFLIKWHKPSSLCTIWKITHFT